jgi:hypothetical protein
MTSSLACRVVASAATTLLGAAFAAPAAGAPRQPAPGVVPDGVAPDAVSANWAGYDLKGGPFQAVSASWVQPAVTCDGGADTYASFWVGLDGDGSDTVEQAGTAAQCRRGRPVYYAWYEMAPKFERRIALAVRPGDRISASATTADGVRFVLTVRNDTSGRSFSITRRSSAARLVSAEVMAEAPSTIFGVLPLADFGTVRFGSALVDGRPLGAGAGGANRVTMSNGTQVKASASPLRGGTDFSVTFRHW